MSHASLLPSKFYVQYFIIQYFKMPPKNCKPTGGVGMEKYVILAMTDNVKR